MLSPVHVEFPYAYFTPFVSSLCPCAWWSVPLAYMARKWWSLDVLGHRGHQNGFSSICLPYHITCLRCRQLMSGVHRPERWCNACELNQRWSTSEERKLEGLLRQTLEGLCIVKHITNPRGLSTLGFHLPGELHNPYPEILELVVGTTWSWAGFCNEFMDAPCKQFHLVPQ